MMVPKLNYLLLSLCASLVAGLPQGGSQAKDLGPLQIEEQRIHLDSIDPNDKNGVTASVFGSVVKFNNEADITDPKLVGLAQAAYQEMINLSPDNAARPPVMSALKVGNEVILSSSMKMGATYIYQMPELEDKDKKKPGKEPERGFGDFTSVMKDAPDVAKALDACREKSCGLKPADGLKAKRADPAPNTTGQGTKNTKTGKEDQKQNAEEGKDKKDSKKTSYQHRRDAACGEVMASIRYQVAHPGEKLSGRKPSPVVVAWNAGGKSDASKGSVMNACGNNLKDIASKGSCDWGCGAFADAMGFEDLRKKKSLKADLNFGQFTAKSVKLPEMQHTAHGGSTDAGTIGTGKDGVSTSPGKDGVSTSPGKDGVSTGPGKDGVSTGPGKDGVSTGPGKDGVSTGPGKDGVSTGPGKDGVSTGPGKDGVSTGPGKDGVSTGGRRGSTGAGSTGSRRGSKSHPK